MSKKYSVLFGMASQTKLKGPFLYNEYEFGGQKLLNIKALDLSLKASVIQKLYLNPNWFSSILVGMSHPMFKKGLFPFIQITPAHFRLFEKEIISKISLFFLKALETWLVQKMYNFCE